MEEHQAIQALAALAQEYRLRIFRLLAKRGDEGMAAGKIADRLEIPAATLSFHIKRRNADRKNNASLTDRRQRTEMISFATRNDVVLIKRGRTESENEHDSNLRQTIVLLDRGLWTAG